MAGAGERYDEIGRSYTRTRREDRRIAATIEACIGPAAHTIVNIGAGTGSYEPRRRSVIAVEPSVEMLRQRDERPAPAVRAVAEALPFPDDAFDAALAVLTMHHWSGVPAGLAEMRRVARRQVVFFFEPLRTHAFWGLDYFPEALELATEKDPPGEDALRQHLDVHRIETVLVPHDCEDGFGAAFWRRPEAYLDPHVQAGMSWLAMLSSSARRRGSDRLRADLESGAWDDRYGHLRAETQFDAGYRIAVAGVEP